MKHALRTLVFLAMLGGAAIAAARALAGRPQPVARRAQPRAQVPVPPEKPAAGGFVTPEAPAGPRDVEASAEERTPQPAESTIGEPVSVEEFPAVTAGVPAEESAGAEPAPESLRGETGEAETQGMEVPEESELPPWARSQAESAPGSAAADDTLRRAFDALAAEAQPEAEALPPTLEAALAEASPAPITTAASRDAESYLDEGNVYFNVGQYGLAIDRYAKAIELAPDLTAAYYNRANARTRAGEYDGALEDYDRALALHPSDADALNNRGMLYLYRADYEAALRDFNAALAEDPSDTTVIVNRGLAHLHGGDSASALVDFKEAASLDPGDAAAHYGAGQAAAALGNRDEALRHLRRALEIDPAYAREAAGDPKLAILQGDEEFIKLLRESGSRTDR